jgi:quercetin dioxygenase-like cupin family protein
MDVVRFGVGHRRPEGPPGTTGLAGALIHTDGRGLVAELAFGRNARLEPHSNPNTTWFVAIEGGGWVGVGDERARVSAGEAVLWPADVIHTAWTEHSEMRAIVVEFAGPDDSAASVVNEARPDSDAGTPGTFPAAVPRGMRQPAAEPRTTVGKGDGGLAAHERRRDDTTREGEPF